MPDREKVIKTLESCMRDDNSCDGCPLYGADGWCESEEIVTVPKDYAKLAVAMLKAQEPVAPIPTLDDDWVCGDCGESVVGYTELETGGFEDVRHNFCPHCGKAVKWE